MLSFISDIAHYTRVLDLVTKAKKTLWIGTADIKEASKKLHTKAAELFN